MPRRNTVSALLLGLVVAACGGAEEMEEAQPAEMEVAQVAEAPDCYIARGTFAETQDRPSPLHSTEFTFDGGTGLLCYGAPSANEREVMGALVPFGEPWRLGANEATALHLTGPAQIGGVALEAGSYSIYAVPGETEWEFFINSAWERWGIPINEDVQATNIGSFTAEPTAADAMTETLDYSYNLWDNGTMGDIVLTWENTAVQFHVHPGS